MTVTREAITKPVGPIGRAGAERSELWERHMDGAIHSGERAATGCAAALTCAETASVEQPARASAPTLPTGRHSFGHAPPLGLAHAALSARVARAPFSRRLQNLSES